MSKKRSKVHHSQKMNSNDIIDAINASNEQCKTEIIDYIKNTYLDFSDDDIIKIVKLKEKLEQKESNNSELAKIYKETIRKMLLIITLGCLALGFNFSQKLSQCDGYYVLGKLCIMTLFTPFIMSLSQLLNDFISCIIIGVLGFFSMYVYYKAAFLPFPMGKYGFISFICFFIIMACLISYKDARNLTKSDAYNIMILILTLISLSISLYTLFFS